MRKLFILLLGIVFYSCSENDRLIYSEGMHDIYYSDVTKDKDSIFVSLLTAERELTTTINVKLLGDTLRVSEKFKLQVIPGKTTAKEVFITRNFLKHTSSLPGCLSTKCR